MDKEMLEVFCQISANLAKAKALIAENVKDREKYIEIRNILGDCQEVMAIKADTAPINLISGNVLNAF
jgi:hypothetical protein